MDSIGGKNIILGVTGGIAAYKSPELARRLREAGAVVRVVMTDAARQFISPLTLQAVSGAPVRLELLDSEAESGMDHIEFARWADLVVVAPATADFIARLAAGIADDLLTTLCLATEAPVAVAPAMNRVMWSKPVTRRNVDSIETDGMRVLGPGIGAQACGETGPGRMLDVDDLVDRLRTLLAPPDRRLQGRKVMITAGPTFEPIDPVRGITNHSSGKMGFALAAAFTSAGAEVTLVSGPCSLPTPTGTRRVDVVSAAEMYDAVHADIADQSIFVAVAAVADYRPKGIESHKIKKRRDELQLTLVRNPDILASVAGLPHAPFCVGFAAETQDVERYARGKLEAKGLDMIAANLVGTGDGGFNSETNTLLVIDNTRTTSLGPADKREVAAGLCLLIAENYAKKHTVENS